mgnify:CR=1 FL=1
MEIRLSERLRKLPPYLFREVDMIKQKARQEGKRLIDLSIGDPDMPTPGFIVEAMAEAIRDSSTHRYPSYDGLMEFREAVAHWYSERFGVVLDPEREVVALIGSKEGIAHLPFALLDPADEVLVPDPGYPVYTQASILADAIPRSFPLTWEHGFLPTLEELENATGPRTRLIYLNYPNNPTSARAPIGFFEEVAAWAKSKGIVVAHDAAYSEVFLDPPTPSFLQAHGAKEVGVEFHSLSKTFSMTGWRIGFCVGNASVLKALVQVKSNMDSGVFEAVQKAGVVALRNAKHTSRAIASVYAQRRKQTAGRLKSVGIEVFSSDATFYLWCKVPKGFDSRNFAKRLIEERQVVVTPGVGFGSMGEGYFRISLTAPDEMISSGVERIAQAF